MASDDEPRFTAEQAVAIQRELRRLLGLEPELFPLQAFVGMISDEIEQMRGTGRGDPEICAVVERLSGQLLTPEDLARCYAPPELRHPRQ